MQSINIIQFLNSDQNDDAPFCGSQILMRKQKTAVFSTSFDLYSSNISRFYLPQFYSNDKNTVHNINPI